jgi:hypothetical protein
MKCIKCNQEIPALRLKALPQTKTCIACSNTSRVAGFPIISSKTTYSELQVVSQETADILYARQERKGNRPSEGMNQTKKD